MKMFKGQIVKQCLLFNDINAQRSHLMVQLANGSWHVDSRSELPKKRPTKTFIKRRCLLRGEFGSAATDVTSYDL